MRKSMLKSISTTQARPHRQAILRPGQPVESVTYPRDDDPESGHFAIFQDDEIVAVASVLLGPLPFDREPQAWRIRGMGTYPHARGLGYGSMLICACIDHVASKQGEFIWCTARTPVLKFYAINGFVRYGDEFEIPGAGSHYIMYQRVSRPEG
jgi:predicted GNAT family N-acyltransferase